MAAAFHDASALLVLRIDSLEGSGWKMCSAGEPNAAPGSGAAGEHGTRDPATRARTPKANEPAAVRGLALPIAVLDDGK